jgi:hypothetical protein
MEDEYILMQSVFIEDPLNPGLPVYSEWGYNTFGAYYDRTPIRSNDYILPSKIFVNQDTLNFMLQGEMKSGQSILLKFSIKGFSPQNEYELVSLNNIIINLKNSANKVVFKISNQTYNLQIIEGELHFKKAQKMFLDNELFKTILCGTFRFKTFINNEPVSIYNGRFDVSIGYENFFNY